MEMKKGLKTTCKETVKLVGTFFKPVGIKDNLLKLPTEINRMGTRLGLFSTLTTLVALVFSYMLKVSNLMIEQRLIILGIILFCLYKGQDIFRTVLSNFYQERKEQYSEIFDNEIIFRGGNIIGKVSDKVMKYDQKQKVYKLLSSEEILNSVKAYLSNLWEIKNGHKFDLITLLETIIMLIVAIITNTEVDQRLFIPIIIIFSFICFLTTAYVSLNRKEFRKNEKKYYNLRDLVANDLIRVQPIVSQDLEMRLDKLDFVNKESRGNIKNYSKKRSKTYLINAILEVVSQYSVIVIYLLSVNRNEIDLATITQITALLAIVNNALGNISTLAHIFEEHQEKVMILEREEEDMKLIIKAYYKEMEYQNSSKEIEHVTLKPFQVSYFEESENDKAFTLVSNQQIKISKGQVAILYGPSGSGKSTFMKMLTGRISLEKSEELPSTSRFLFYDEKLKFGSLSLFEEIFCSEENPNLPKMESIMRELHLWQELERNCHDVWTWLKEKHQNSNGPLSNGQNQRLILAKMLYWLDENVDVLVLDECTSGLDATGGKEESADAQRILEYVVRYANKDKKRICVISTHQNIDVFCNNISKEIPILNIYFQRKGDRNLITL